MYVMNSSVQLEQGHVSRADSLVILGPEHGDLTGQVVHDHTALLCHHFTARAELLELRLQHLDTSPGREGGREGRRVSGRGGREGGREGEWSCPQCRDVCST